MEQEILDIVRRSLAEDIGRGDVTVAATIPADARGSFKFVAREDIVACGAPIVREIFAQLSSEITFIIKAKEGEMVKAGNVLATVGGLAAPILTGERVALNLWQRMSGIATLTHHYVEAVKGTKAIVRDTRKTMPGLRIIDKYAVRIGGGQNHRMRLDDAILIKDNHIAACGGVATAVQKAKAQQVPVQVECDTLSEVEDALKAGANSILLDNMSVERLKQAVKLVNGQVKLEASGGVTLENIRAVAETGVDYIAIGALTHSARAVDIGLDF